MLKIPFSNRAQIIVVLLFICSMQQVLYSQDNENTLPSDTTAANDYFQQGEIFLKKQKFDSSIICFDKAGSIYQREQVWCKYVRCLNLAGDAYRMKGQYDSAMSCLNRSLALGLEKCGNNRIEIAQAYHVYGNIYYVMGNYDSGLNSYQKALSIRLAVLGERHEDVASVLNNIGLIYDAKGEYDKALEYQNKSLSIGLLINKNSSCVANNLNNIGSIYESKGDVDKALEYDQKALSMRLAVLGEKHGDVAGSYNNIGNIYNNKGDYDKALQFLEKSLSIFLEIFGEQHPTIASLYQNIGIVYDDKGDYETALKYHQKGLFLLLEVLGEDNPQIALKYFNVGEVYQKKGDYDNALKYYQKALSIHLKALGEKHNYIAQIYNNLGTVYDSKKNNTKALEYFKKSLKVNLEIVGQKNPFVSETYYNIAYLYFKQNMLAKALEYYQKSVISLAQDFHETNIYANPILTNINSEPILLTTLEFKADAFTQLYKIKSKNLKDLKCALNTYELASDLIKKIKHSYQSEGSKLQLGKQSLRIYEKAIATALYLYEITHKVEYKEKAFAFSEKGKASIILQALSESQAKQFAGISSDLLEKERDIKVDLAFYEKNLFEEQGKGKKANKSEVTLLQDKLFVLNRQNDSLTHRFETEYPEYYDLKYRTSIISPKEIQTKLLKKDDMLIEYFTGDSSISIFTLTQQTLNVITVKKDTLFENQVKSMKEGLAKRDYALYTENAYRLYQLLLEPIKTDITNKNLIVIPDGILGYIPFETLLTQKTDSGNKDYRQLAYLIKDNQITYDYSATLLYENTVKGKKKNESRYVGFAPVTFK